MNLQPVDFKAVAAKGAYVYCYLRTDGTPYYVGIATTSCRPFHKSHNAKPPREHKERVRVMRSGLTRDEACAWEVFYISHYGRKDTGSGILRNLSDGGEKGSKGAIRSAAFRKAVAERCKGVKRSAADMRGVLNQAKQRLAAASNQYGCTVEQWTLLTKTERSACKLWLAENPEQTAANYIEKKEAGAFEAKARSAHRAYPSLIALGMTMDQAISCVASTTARQRDKMKAWLKRDASRTPIQYLKRIGAA